MPIVTEQDLIDAKVDAQTLADIINGPVVPGTVTTRLGRIIKTLAKAISDIPAGALDGKNKTTFSTSPPPSPIAGDQWFNTDTTTVCPDNNCKGHILLNGIPQVGSFSHRITDWPHVWTGSAWIDARGYQSIVASDIVDAIITGQKIADAAISASKIMDGAVSGSKLVDGSILTAKLADNAVALMKLAAGAVDTTKLVDGAVIAAKIAAAAIETAKLANDAVTVDKMAANSVTAKQLIITDFTNLCQNPNGDSYAPGTFIATGWEYAGDISVDKSLFDASLPTGARGLAQTVRDEYFGQAFPCNPGDQFFISSDHYTVGCNFATTVGLFFSTDSGGGGIINWYSAGTATANTAGKQSISGVITAPAGTQYARVWAQINGSSGFGTNYFRNVFVQKRANANLIVDGAITTAKLDALAVTAAKIAAGSIETSKLAAGAVTANELAALSVIAGKIAAGAVTATELAAGAVIAGKIAAGVITANELAAGAVTAGKIAAAVVGTNELAAKAITAGKLVVTNFDNLIPNPSSEDTITDSISSAYVVDVGLGVALSGTKVRQVVESGAYAAGYVAGSQLASAPSIPCAPGDQFYFEAQARFSAAGMTGTLRTGMRFDDISGTAVGWANPTGVAGSTAWQKGSSIGTAPAGAVAVSFYVEGVTLSAGAICWFDALYCRRRASGELIVDGAITTQKLVAGAITANELAASAVTAGKIDGDAIATTDYLETTGTIYPENVSGTYATQGAKIFKNESGTGSPHARIGPGGMRVGRWKLDEATVRAVTALASDGTRVWYRGNNDSGGVPILGEGTGYRTNPRISATLRRLYFTTPKFIQVQLKIQPLADTDNLDGLNYVLVKYKGTNQIPPTACTVYNLADEYHPIGSRRYQVPGTPSDANNATIIDLPPFFSETWDPVAGSATPYCPALMITIFNPEGSSQEMCLYLTSRAENTAFTLGGSDWNNAVSHITGPSGGGSGGGGGGGGACIAPETLILVAPGVEIKAGDLTLGQRILTVDEYGEEPAFYRIGAISIHHTERLKIKLIDGRELVCSPGHRVRVWGKYVAVSTLLPGDRIDGPFDNIVDVVCPVEAGPVIKITVPEAQTYVSAGILSHNRKPA